MYPWGNEWDCQHCNNSVPLCKSTQTSLVTAYVSKGDSPFGVADMAGNVWEWTLSEYVTAKNDDINAGARRVLRGGAWNLGFTDNFYACCRNRNNPHDRGNDIGFRVVRS